MQRIIVKTSDGSHSLFIKELNEHYHSIHGAIQESEHVYINAGLRQFISTKETSVSLNILEIGLGTGLNALLTLIQSERFDTNIYYTAIEAYPLELVLIEQLNYLTLLNAQHYANIFNEIHICEWNKSVKLTDRFTINKKHTTLQKASIEGEYDIVYFDAFGPRVQPEMWTEDVFKKLYTVIKFNGCLVTYCAKGEVKRILKKVGFIVEPLPGPPGKREIVRAWKNREGYKS